MDRLVQYLKRIYLQFKYRHYGWRGNYASWQEAAAQCGGYNADNILRKVRAATLKVKNGEAVYERDSVLYPAIEYSWPLLANLLLIAGKNNQRLSVLDFGGSLGSSYFQNRHQLSHLDHLQWSVVEQPTFVAAGKKDIAGSQLDFFDTIEQAQQQRGGHQVLLLSCVLPYLEKPYAFLAEAAAQKIPYIIVEDTYFNPTPANRLTIQRVPPFYYEASYPAWFLNYEEVLAVLGNDYNMMAAYNNEQILYLDGQLLHYKGFIMQLKT
jgi:putative methyltransferase (TIGR04325 family)